MLLQVHDIVTIVTAVTIMTLVIILFLLHIESGSRWHQLRRARGYLVAASAVVALTGIFGITFGNQNTNWALVSSSTLFVGLIQATIFTYICIWMVHPEFRSRIPISIVLSGCAVVGGAAITLSAVSPEDYEDWRWAWSVFLPGR